MNSSTSTGVVSSASMRVVFTTIEGATDGDADVDAAAAAADVDQGATDPP